MNEMKERLIEAVHCVRFHWNDDESIVNEVLKELREPTPAMLKRFRRLMDAYSAGLIPKDSDLLECWRAAIDEVLE